MQGRKAFATFNEQKILEKITSAPAKLTIGLFGAESEIEKSIFIIPDMSFGKTEFLNTTANNSQDEYSKLGVHLLKYGNLILDFSKEKFYFEAFNEKNDISSPYPLYMAVYENGEIIIGMVVNESLRKIITIGDVITSIDGKKIENVDCSNVLNLQSAKEKLTVMHNNQEIEININDFK